MAPQRQIVIGDIHGCYDELMDLLDAVAATDSDIIVSVGDLVDRGPKSLEVCRFFQERENSVVLMGNHERKHVRNVRSYSQDIVAVQMGDAYEGIVEWMSGFPYFVEYESAIVVHAAFEHDVPLAEQRENVLAGTTSGARHLETRYGELYWSDYYAGEKPIIFGHHVVGDEVVIYGERVYGIDTGACHGGRLSAVILPELRIESVPSRRDYWAEQKVLWQAPVLAAKPWPSMSFAKIERKLAEAGDTRSDVAEVKAAIKRWVVELENVCDTAAAIIASEVDDLLSRHGEAGFAQAAGAHPGRKWMFRHRKKPLDGRSLLANCSGPAYVLDLAAAFDIAVSERPVFAI